MYIKFFAFITFFLSIIAFGSYIIYTTLISNGLVTSALGIQLLRLTFVIFPVMLVVTMILGNLFYNPITNAFYIVATLYLAILLYLFLGSLMLVGTRFILELPFLHFSWVEHFMRVATYFVVGATFCTIGIGVANANVPRVRELPLHSKELAAKWYGKRILLVSDIHLGMVRGKNFSKRIADKINTLGADVVLITGDIIDGPVFPYERDLEPFRAIRARYGVFGVDGNHEKYNKHYEFYEKTVNDLFPILNDKRVLVDGVQIIGIDYRANEPFSETQERLAQTGFQKELPSIVMLHDPKNTPALATAGVSVVVSGHTHCGQFFPINLIVQALYGKYTYGFAKTNDTLSYTTCGIGTALSPIRIGNTPEIVVFTVEE